MASFERAAQALAAGIAATATLVEIDIAVIGGGVGKAGDVLFTPLRAALTTTPRCPSSSDLTVVPAQMGTDAGLVGRGRGGADARADDDGGRGLQAELWRAGSGANVPSPGRSPPRSAGVEAGA